MSVDAKRCRHETAAQVAKSVELVLAEEHGCLRTATAMDPVNQALRRIGAPYDSLAAPLDTLLADIAVIEHNTTDIASNAPALTPTSPSPSEPLAAMSPAHHPVQSYLGALLNTNEGRHAPSVGLQSSVRKWPLYLQ